MTEIDLTKSKFLLSSLKYITDGISELSPLDPAIRNIATKLRSFMLEPSNVAGEDLVKIIDETKDIVNSYNIKVKEVINSGNKDETTDLPNALYNARNETENLISIKKLEHQDAPSDKFSQLIKNINKFHSLATSK